MGTLGILTCEILELEFAHLLNGDPDIKRVAILEDAHSAHMIETLEAIKPKQVNRLPGLASFKPDPDNRINVIVRVLELGLHNRKHTLQQGLVQAAREMGPYVDAFLLGYGLCGNAFENPDELLSDAGVPVFIPMDEDHPVDDCVGLIIGGRKRYYGEQCKVAGTFFMIPGWTYHWQRMFDQEFGSLSVDLAKWLFKDYERSLLVSTPVMSEAQMEKNVQEFSSMFGLRTEACTGRLDILADTWNAAKDFIRRLN